MMDVVAQVRELFEPAATTTVVVDATASAPFVYEANHLYAWALPGNVHEPWGTGESTKRFDIERFSIRVVYVAPQTVRAEMKAKVRDASVSSALDTKADAYMTALRGKPVNTPYWHQLAGRVDHDAIRTLDVRAVALTLDGYRFRT